MKCPACKTVALAIAERQGIEIDYCPDCRGVWLDRGELDKLIERADASYRRPNEHARGDERHDERYDDRDDDREEGGMFGFGRKKGGRRESMLSDFFDFG